MVCTCTYCGAELERKYKRKRTFCDYRCQRKYDKANQKKELLICAREGCEQSFFPLDERHKYCSRKCRNKNFNDHHGNIRKAKLIEEKSLVVKKCEFVLCKNNIPPTKNKHAKFCSKKCKSQALNCEIKLKNIRKKYNGNKT